MKILKTDFDTYQLSRDDVSEMCILYLAVKGVVVGENRSIFLTDCTPLGVALDHAAEIKVQNTTGATS